MSFSLMELNLETISRLEQLRFDAYGIEGINCLKTLYANDLLNGEYISYGVFYNGQLVGACYISKTYDSLFVDQLFVAKKLQNCGLHLGSSLLKYVLSQKDYIESYFGLSFNYSYLDSVDGATKLYTSIGYEPASNMLMKKRLN